MTAAPRPRADPAPRHQVDLAPLTSFGVGARARVLYTLDAEADLDPVLDAVAADARRVGLRPFVLGGGSNLLIARDLDEPVLQMRLRGRRLLADAGQTLDIEIGAGETWHDTVRWTLAQGWYGLENLALIPGLVGGAPWQNIGAYGVEVAERILSVSAVHLDDRHRVCWSTAECGFGYRSSRFKTDPQRPWLITAVRFRLSRVPAPRLGYGELAGSLPPDPTPLQVADTVEAIRRRKLPDPARLGNAGSFFKNPIVDRTLAERLQARHPAMPCWPGSGGDTIKLSAGWLIEQAGWKGHRDGDAGVSADHALVLVNHGRATGAGLLALAGRIQASVQQRFDVLLEPEPVILK